MNPIPVSVIVVSRDRPDALIRCLTAISQLRYPSFEVVVVADPAAVRRVEDTRFGSGIKCIEFDFANVSAARNTGLMHAAGEVVAFIDDDAVPEPSWLLHLIPPFVHEAVSAAGGLVRGRNGISFQWKGRAISSEGVEAELNLPSDRPCILTPRAARAIKTQGTNMAFRRSVLARAGGFDPAFHFFHDDADVNMRLSKDGHSTAIVPLAEVHHGFANSSRRTNRVPTTLFEVGASWAVFLRKHCPQGRVKQVWTNIQKAEQNRLLRHMVSGALEPREVRSIMASLKKGYGEGAERPLAPLSPLPDCSDAFMPFHSGVRSNSQLISGRIWNARALRSKARDLVTSGHIVTLVLMSPTALFHHVRYDDDGYWEQRGGLFGRSLRDSPLFKFNRFSTRIKAERQRIFRQRLL